MKINLNIIKIIFFWAVASSILLSYTWIEIACPTCDGCKDIQGSIESAADLIEEEHTKLENQVEEKYEKEITGDEKVLYWIDKIQKDMAVVVVHMAALEEEANIDDKKLLFLLKKSQDFSTLNKAVE